MKPEARQGPDSMVTARAKDELDADPPPPITAPITPCAITRSARPPQPMPVWASGPVLRRGGGPGAGLGQRYAELGCHPCGGGGGMIVAADYM
jgi:hypothetical protein